MAQVQETNLALYIDFDNIALGARDAHQRFDIQLLLQRVLEKGKIVVKKAYADWSHHKQYMTPLHEAGIELIEIPTPHISGKNSADIRMVVDAMDLCYSKDHINAFVIVSGDSDFSPLVSKLRENNKVVIGIGVKNSTSHLLVGNCDEFIFYDDIYNTGVGRLAPSLVDVPEGKRKLFDFLVTTTKGLLQEIRGNLYSSLIKDTMKRKRPDFNEGKYGYSTFGDLLEDAKNHGLLDVVRDVKAGGTWVVQGLGNGAATRMRATESADVGTENGNQAANKSRLRRRSSRRSRRGGRKLEPALTAQNGEAVAPSESAMSSSPEPAAPEPAPETPAPARAEAETAGATPQKKATKKAAKKTAKKTAKKAVKTTTATATDKTGAKKTSKAGGRTRKTAKKAEAKDPV